MASPFDFFPLRDEDIFAIRARLDADANMGLTPESPEYLDTIEGGFYWDLTQSLALEIERLWDFGAREVPASIFLQYSWGEYLDEWGEVLAVERKDAVRATGEVTFVGEDAVISTGTQVAPQVTDADEDPEAYQTLAGAILPAPPVVTATPFTTGGTLAADTYRYKVTATNAAGETTGSAEVTAVTTGATGRVDLDWPDVPGATGYKVYRRTTGTLQFLASAASSSYSDTAAATPTTGEPPTVATTAVTLAVEAIESGSQGNTAFQTISELLTPVDGIAELTNYEPVTGGADIEEDDAYRDRLMLSFSGSSGAGTYADYQRWALEHPGVGYVAVQPLQAGPGTVRVVIMDVDGNPVSNTVVEALQGELDPFSASTQLDGAWTSPAATITVDSTTNFRDSGKLRLGTGISQQIVAYTGKTATTFTGVTGGSGTVADNSLVRQGGEGRGLAPIGAEVIVGTPSTVIISVTGNVIHETGYSIDGANGTIATGPDVIESIREYIDGLKVGEDVILNHVEARFFRVEGVYNVSGVQINGAAADVLIAPEAVAAAGTITVT